MVIVYSSGMILGAVCPLKLRFSRIFHISFHLNGSTLDFWDSQHNSWNIFSGRFLKDDEIVDLQALLSVLDPMVVGSSKDVRIVSLETLGQCSASSLSHQLASSTPIYSDLFSAIWKSKSPKRINILIWIILNGSLNTFEVLQRKLP